MWWKTPPTEEDVRTIEPAHIQRASRLVEKSYLSPKEKNGADIIAMFVNMPALKDLLNDAIPGIYLTCLGGAIGLVVFCTFFGSFVFARTVMLLSMAAIVLVHVLLSGALLEHAFQYYRHLPSTDFNCYHKRPRLQHRQLRLWFLVVVYAALVLPDVWLHTAHTLSLWIVPTPPDMLVQGIALVLSIGSVVAVAFAPVVLYGTPWRLFALAIEVMALYVGYHVEQPVIGQWTGKNLRQRRRVFALVMGAYYWLFLWGITAPLLVLPTFHDASRLPFPQSGILLVIVSGLMTMPVVPLCVVGLWAPGLRALDQFKVEHALT